MSRIRRSVAAVAAVLTLAGCASAPGAATTPGPPQSAGSVPWTDAVAPSRTASIVTVTAAVGAIAERSGCAVISGSPTVVETATTVVIRVRAEVRRFPPWTACAADLVSGVGVRVPLHAALGSRRLIDGFRDRPHAVFVLASAPAVHGLPSGFTERTPWWRESARVTHLWWRDAHDRQIDLDEGPASTVDRWLPSLGTAGTNARAVRIGRVPGTLQRDDSGGTPQMVVRWSPRQSTTLVLSLFDQSTSPLSEGELLALARSVR